LELQNEESISGGVVAQRSITVYEGVVWW